MEPLVYGRRGLPLFVYNPEANGEVSRNLAAATPVMSRAPDDRWRPAREVLRNFYITEIKSRNLAISAENIAFLTRDALGIRLVGPTVASLGLDSFDRLLTIETREAWHFETGRCFVVAAIHIGIGTCAAGQGSRQSGLRCSPTSDAKVC